eukprot:1829202-Ditylum_brightwellii.AAC.1
MPGLWKHMYHDTTFALCVNDFGVKYTPTVDWDGKTYCGLDLDWHYDEKFVDITVPEYVEKALIKLGHKKPTKPKHSPHCHIKI